MTCIIPIWISLWTWDLSCGQLTYLCGLMGIFLTRPVTRIGSCICKSPVWGSWAYSRSQNMTLQGCRWLEVSSASWASKAYPLLTFWSSQMDCSIPGFCNVWFKRRGPDWLPHFRCLTDVWGSTMSDEGLMSQSRAGRNECVVHSYKILQILIYSQKSCIFSEIRRSGIGSLTERN